MRAKISLGVQKFARLRDDRGAVTAEYAVVIMGTNISK